MSVIQPLKRQSKNTRTPQEAHDPVGQFTFIELFAGIGGFRIGLTRAGGRHLYSNDWDKFAHKTYVSWFGAEGVDFGDIRKVDNYSLLPDHDVLSAGFPCQPFSIAGVSKKNSLGRPHGFSDQEQGNLFFTVCDVIAAKRPRVILLENVRNLLSHDGGKTWRIIMESLDLLGYSVQSKVINAAKWVPQNRRRVFIVGFLKGAFHPQVVDQFQFPDDSGTPRRLREVLHRTPPDSKYMLTDNLWSYLQQYAELHKSRGNGFGCRVFGPGDTAATLSARYYKDGAEILIDQSGWRNPRRLTPAEAARLMGFNGKLARDYGYAKGFPQVVSDVQAYRQFGNSVCPLVVEEMGKSIAKVFELQKSQLNKR
jgi:DNA (cytosine-5)-methyltransferase 1